MGRLDSKAEYRAWKAMRWRCSPKNPMRNRYFDRNIKVCERWNIFSNFLKDMGDKPYGDFSVDRIDNDKGYSPENCRWATRVQQTNNTYRTNFIIHNGKRITLMEIVRLTGIHPETVRARIKKGFSYENIVAIPRKPKQRERNQFGQFV